MLWKGENIQRQLKQVEVNKKQNKWKEKAYKRIVTNKWNIKEKKEGKNKI